MICGTGNLVLVVDDNASIRLAVAVTLQRAGYTVVTATTGLEAIEAVLAHEFVVIVMDVRMPEMDGITATKIIRERGFQMGIVGYSADARREDCLDSGMDDFLEKPAPVEIMVGTVAILSDKLVA